MIRPAQLRLAFTRSGPYVLTALAIVGFAIAIAALAKSPAFAYDYRAYDAAARRLLAGLPLYLPHTAASYNAGDFAGLYLYPPPIAVAFVPLALLDPRSAAIVFAVGRAVLLIVGCWILPVRPIVRASTLAVSLFSFPVLYDLNLGNTSILVFALTALAWRVLDTPSSSIAAALLTLVRVPFGILALSWLARGRVANVVWLVVAGGIAIALTLPIVGTSAFSDYLAMLVGLRDLSTSPENISLATMVVAMGGNDLAARAAVLAGYAIAVVMVVVAGRRCDRDAAFVVAVIATLFAAPFFHPHYLVVLLLPGALLADRGRAWGILLPLLGWLPGPLLPLVGLACLVLPVASVPPSNLRERVAGSAP